MDFIAYITLCLILVAPSCHSTREERAARAAWGDLDANSQKTYKYLALVNCATGACSGSIISETMVITYCAIATTDCAVYAGSHSVSVSTKNKAANMQVRQVQTVKDAEELKELKICVMNDTWIFGENVGAISLHPNGKREQSVQKCNVLGFKKDGGNYVGRKIEQNIGGEAQCQPQERAVSAILYSNGANVDGLLKEGDYGGPAVTVEGKLLAINKMGDTLTVSGKQVFCNTYIEVAKYSKWIEEQKTAAESGASGGTGGNSTSPSSGYSIHSYLNKYSNWKVLGFLVPTIVTFLQY